MFDLFKRLFRPSQPPSGARPRPALSATPDAPVPFGYKIGWFAVQIDEPHALIEALALYDVAPANWATGLAAAHHYAPEEAPRVFVTPAIGGWVLAVSGDFPCPADGEDSPYRELGVRFDRLFESLAQRFDHVHFFATHRVSGFDAWARARGGAIERVFAVGDGQVMANRGAQTPEERNLGLPDLTGKSTTECETFLFDLAEKTDQARAAHEADLIASGMEAQEAGRQAYRAIRSPFPHEEDTNDLAGAWSVDPRRIDEIAPSPSLGWIGALATRT